MIKPEKNIVYKPLSQIIQEAKQRRHDRIVDALCHLLQTSYNPFAEDKRNKVTEFLLYYGIFAVGAIPFAIFEMQPFRKTWDEFWSIHLFMSYLNLLVVGFPLCLWGFYVYWYMTKKNYYIKYFFDISDLTGRYFFIFKFIGATYFFIILPILAFLHN